MTPPVLQPFSLDRMVLAVELVRERLMRSTAALEAAGVPYAVIGGNAVAAWVSRIDPAAIRNTRDVNILVRRDDHIRSRAAVNQAGLEFSLDGSPVHTRDAAHALTANEKVRPAYLFPAPDVEESESGPAYRLLTLEALVRMKLTAFRTIDRVHLADMLEVGLIDPTWTNRVPPVLAGRLQELIDAPDG